MNITVIICTHNPRRDYLERTLAGLRRQTLPTKDWELLLIDNASREPVSAAWDISWHPEGRHVREDEVGLTMARLRGIREARGELLVFADDDNVLAPEYLSEALAIAERHPELGNFGAGRLEPEFEMPPPPELKPRLQLLALREVAETLISHDPLQARCMPWGAGLCVRRSVGAEFARLVDRLRATVVLGRRGNHLFSGEDDLFSWASAGLGLGFGIFPSLRLQHLISKGRLSRTYFRRLIHDHAFSNGVTRHLLTGRPSQPISLWRYVRILLHGVRNGWFSMQCQLAESRGEAAAGRFVLEQQLQPLALATARDSAVERTS